MHTAAARSPQTRRTCNVTLNAMLDKNAVMLMLTRAVLLTRGSAKANTAMPTMKKSGTMLVRNVDCQMRSAWKENVTCGLGNTTREWPVVGQLPRHTHTSCSAVAPPHYVA